jgi:hypothetical protein
LFFRSHYTPPPPPTRSGRQGLPSIPSDESVCLTAIRPETICLSVLCSENTKCGAKKKKYGKNIPRWVYNIVDFPSFLFGILRASLALIHLYCRYTCKFLLHSETAVQVLDYETSKYVGSFFFNPFSVHVSTFNFITNFMHLFIKNYHHSHLKLHTLKMSVMQGFNF